MLGLNMVHDHLKRILKNAVAREVLTYLIFYAILTFILFSSLVGSELSLEPGQISPRDIKAPRTATIVDEKQTAQLQEQARNRVRKVYRQDQEALAEADKQVNRFFADISVVKNDENLTVEQKTSKIESQILDKLKGNKISVYNSHQVAVYLMETESGDLGSMQNAALTIVNSIMSQPVTEDTLANKWQDVRTQSADLPFVSNARRIVDLACIQALRPNLIFDARATRQAQDEAVSVVLPVEKTIIQGQVIVREGDLVTEEHIDILRQLRVQRTKSPAITLGGTALFVLIIMGLSLIYIKLFHKELLRQGRLMVLLGLIFLFVIAMAKGIMSVINIGDRPEVNGLVGYLIPVAAGSMLVSILLNQNLAYFFTFVTSIFVGFINPGNQIASVVTAFTGGAVGAFRVAKLGQTGDLAKSGLYIALINILTILTMSLIFSSISLQLAGFGALFGILNGLFSAVLTIGLLPYLESGFSVTSSIRLLELSNPNEELLRRMLVEAPGTYHHSIMVGNLAEAAAEKVGAQPLMVRVGAYYHDIGKLKRPYFFVENQLGAENPHEKIAPSLSALIITSHIKDGVELAREARLPRPIIDFIEQHHGTTLVKFFYSRALEEDEDGNVNEESFRYEGPKPQSKEVALVMLADSVEAAVRSLQDHSPGRMEGMIRRIIKDRLYDGQLEECSLTFRDLDIIAESFFKVLNGVYHSRVEYPETLAREFEKRRENLESVDSKPTNQS
ncbi:MAG: HD family phosphohydrolase [Chitinophagales bacterium]